MARTARNISASQERITVQDARFVIEYIKDGNGKRSALDAGLVPSGNGPHAAAVASKLLKKPQILAAIREQLMASSARTLITIDRLLQEVYRGATYNVADAFDENGTCKAMKDMSEDLQRAIEGFEIEEVRGRPGTFISKYKFSKKAVAQQILLDRLENLVKRFEVTGKNGAPLHQSDDSVMKDVSLELLKRIVGITEAEKPK